MRPPLLARRHAPLRRWTDPLDGGRDPILPVAAQEPGPSPSPRASRGSRCRRRIGAARCHVLRADRPRDATGRTRRPAHSTLPPSGSSKPSARRITGPRHALRRPPSWPVAGVAVVDQGSLELLVPIDGQSSGLRFLDWQLHASYSRRGPATGSPDGSSTRSCPSLTTSRSPPRSWLDGSRRPTRPRHAPRGP